MSTTNLPLAPDRYTVIGNPVEHSLSPQIHAEFAQETQQSIFYDTTSATENSFCDILLQFQENGGKGANITSPFKQEAFQLMNELSEYAQLSQAINTVTFFNDGHRIGDNTDGIGLVRALKNYHGVSFAGRDILVLGAGGVVHGIMGALLAESPNHIAILNRTPKKAVDLIKKFTALGPLGVTYKDELNKQPFDLIINAIPARSKQEKIELPGDLVLKNTLCYDLNYGKAAEHFLHWGASLGAKTSDGLSMLVEQAAESFAIWRGVRPNSDLVYKKLRTN